MLWEPKTNIPRTLCETQPVIGAARRRAAPSAVGGFLEVLTEGLFNFSFALNPSSPTTHC